jgi:hypothetical protein
MRRARHVIDEEGLVRRRGVEFLHVADRVVGHVGDQVVVLLTDPGKTGVVLRNR